MNKDLLYAPLIECRESYDDFFKNKANGVNQQDMTRFKKQYQIICGIITVLDNEPENKQKLMKLFEDMQ